MPTSPQQAVIQAARRYGRWRERANRTKTTKDRIKFVRFETELGMAAQALYESEERLRRAPKHRIKS